MLQILTKWKLGVMEQVHFYQSTSNHCIIRTWNYQYFFTDILIDQLNFHSNNSQPKHVWNSNLKKKTTTFLTINIKLTAIYIKKQPKFSPSLLSIVLSFEMKWFRAFNIHSVHMFFYRVGGSISIWFCSTLFCRSRLHSTVSSIATSISLVDWSDCKWARFH